jgi:dTDP-4-amino-4,6-dideoxygalactose transaminase
VSEFLPFARPEIDERTIAAVADVLRSGWVTTGPQAQRFEEALSARCGGRPVRAFTSATAALEVALALAGVGPGDEVVVPAMTFVASAACAARGRAAVLVDVDLDSRNTDAARIEAALTAHARDHAGAFAGLPVNLAPVYALMLRGLLWRTRRTR